MHLSPFSSSSLSFSSSIWVAIISLDSLAHWRLSSSLWSAYLVSQAAPLYHFSTYFARNASIWSDYSGIDTILDNSHLASASASEDTQIPIPFLHMDYPAWILCTTGVWGSAFGIPWLAHEFSPERSDFHSSICSIQKLCFSAVFFSDCCWNLRFYLQRIPQNSIGRNTSNYFWPITLSQIMLWSTIWFIHSILWNSTSIYSNFHSTSSRVARCSYYCSAFDSYSLAGPQIHWLRSPKGILSRFLLLYFANPRVLCGSEIPYSVDLCSHKLIAHPLHLISNCSSNIGCLCHHLHFTFWVW